MSLNLSLCYYILLLVESPEHQIPFKAFQYRWDEHTYHIPTQYAFVFGIIETHNIDFHLF